MTQKPPLRIMVHRIIEYPFGFMDDRLRLVWVLKGTVQVKFVSGIIELNSNDTEIIGLSTPVGLSGSQDNLTAIFSIDREFAEQHIKGIKNMPLSCNFNYIFPRNILPHEKENMNVLLADLVEVYFSNRDQTLIHEKCIELLYYIADHFNSIANLLEGLPNLEMHMSRFSNINEFIQDNLDKKLTLSEMADREYLSAPYLSHEFKNKYGITFNEILNYYRIIHSVQLLLSTDMTITQISDQCGFSATRYYYRYFKKYLLQSPSAFRKQNKNNKQSYFEYEQVQASKILEAFSAERLVSEEKEVKPYKRVLLINPNTNMRATNQIERIARAAFSSDVLIKTLSVPYGPEVLRTPLDETISELAVMESLIAHKGNYEGAIIACFSDIGTKNAKRLLDVPVLGIAEAAYYGACMLGEHFSVITSGGDLERKLIGTTIERCGLMSKCLSIKSLYIDFLDVFPETTMPRLEELVIECKEKDCADVIVLGCVSMVGMGDALAAKHNIPIIDGVSQAATFMESMMQEIWLRQIRNTERSLPRQGLVGSIQTGHIEGLYQNCKPGKN